MPAENVHLSAILDTHTAVKVKSFAERIAAAQTVGDRPAVPRHAAVGHARNRGQQLRHGPAAGVEVEERLECEVRQLPFHVAGVGVREERVEARRIGGDAEADRTNARMSARLAAPDVQERNDEYGSAEGKNAPGRRYFAEPRRTNAP